MTRPSYLFALVLMLPLTSCDSAIQPAQDEIPATTGPSSTRTDSSDGEAAGSPSEWLSTYGARFDEALAQADLVMLDLAAAPTAEVCQQHQESWEPIDDELNNVIDLMASGMESLGDALFTVLGDVYLALAICTSGETGPALQQQIDLYTIDRETLSEEADVFGWDP